MIKTIKNVAIITVVAMVTFSFTTLKEVKKMVKVEQSDIVWKAYKVTGSHEGTININSGALIFDESVLTGGEFEIDMTSIAVTDIEGDNKAKLEGHLKSDDFFSVEKHSLAHLVFKSVTASGKNSYDVTADLTIKGITNPVAFKISIYGNKATANLKIDRTKYDVRYGSTSFFDDLKDKAIYDEFDLIADLEF